MKTYELYKIVRGDRTLVGYYSDYMAGAAAIEADCKMFDDIDVVYELSKCNDKGSDDNDRTGIQQA